MTRRVGVHQREYCEGHGDCLGWRWVLEISPVGNGYGRIAYCDLSVLGGNFDVRLRADQTYDYSVKYQIILSCAFKGASTYILRTPYVSKY